MNAFPKIFAVGKKYVDSILDGEVEITEKIDGSQFGFGKIDGELVCRSKGKIQTVDNPDDMFKKAVGHIVSVQDKLPDDMFFYAELLNKPKHNNLAYENVPKNNLVLFGAKDMKDNFVPIHNVLKAYAKILDIDVVPLIFKGEITMGELEGLLDIKSFLGGVKIEGFVIKNYNKPFMLGDVAMPLMSGKWVSEEYKEVAKGWHKENTSQGKYQEFIMSYRTDARWEKAVQHLRDNGELTEQPKDIGSLIKEVHRDITDEDMETIKDFLWNEFGKDLLRRSTAGLPEWYKDKLDEANSPATAK